MGRAKEIIVKVIPSSVANSFVKLHHYSGRVAPNSKLHFGAFLDDKLHGVLSYGTPLDKRKVIGLVEGTLWNEMLELNRMAFDDYLPKNAESRVLSICINLIRRNAPHIKWILSYSDGVLCGDGTIYRASGFYLTQINDNTENWKLPNGEVVQACTLRQSGYATWLRPYITESEFNNIRSGATSSVRIMKHINATKLHGYQLRYIYLIDKKCKLNTRIIPFSKIDELGIGMYKGEKISISERNKRAESVTVAHSASSREEAFNSTSALNS